MESSSCRSRAGPWSTGTAVDRHGIVCGACCGLAMQRHHRAIGISTTAVLATLAGLGVYHFLTTDIKYLANIKKEQLALLLFIAHVNTAGE